MIPARLLEDCAHNLRIAYRLPVALSGDLLEAAGADRVTIHEFSGISSGAHDHVVASFSVSPPVRVEGVVGSTELIATYGSLAGPAKPDNVIWVEAQLQDAIDSLAVVQD